MKKVLLVSALVMTIVASMVSGTLAVYQTTIYDIAGDSVVAKKFMLVGEELTSFEAPLKIAPSDKKILSFSVSNETSEVDMSAVATITLAAAATDKLTIEPLTVAVYAGNLTLADIASTSPAPITVDPSGTYINGAGTIIFDLVDFTAYTLDTQEFTVVVEWPVSSGFNDYDYAGTDHATSLTVSVTGEQIITL